MKSTRVGICLLALWMWGGTMGAWSQQPTSPAPTAPASAVPVSGATEPAQVPRLVRFSGTLLDDSGKPRSGVAGITFLLYKDQEGGAPLWLETQNANLDTRGRYSVLLGAGKADGLPTELFASSEARWLAVKAEGQSEQPRVLLLSVPYALKAVDTETLGERPASDSVLSKAEAGNSTATTPTGAVASTGITVPLQAQTDPADAEVPAVTHNSWSKGTAMPTALKFTMTGVIGGKVYVVGGVTNTAVVSKNQVYNPVTNTWSSKAALPLATCDAASAVVKNVLYVFGGSNDGVTVTNAVWAYNPVTNKWSAKSPMPTARASVGAAVENNIIYIIGGTDGHTRFNTVEGYNPATDTWTEEAPLIVGKSEPSVGLVANTIVAADGFSAFGDTGDNEGYNASTNSWKSLTSDPTGRNEACNGPITGRLYVAGGSNGGVINNTNVNESFNLSTNKWATLAPIPHPVVAAGSAVNKGLLYCFGGGDSTISFQGKVFNFVQIYQP